MRRDEADPGKHLIYSLKRDNREDVVEFLARELSGSIVQNIDISRRDMYLITNVPRRSSSILKFGFDHTEELAKRISCELGIEYKGLLVSKSKRAQKETSGIERLTNVNFDYKRGLDINLKGRVALIIDDLVTTGASMSAAAMLIRGLGVNECIAVSIAVANNEDYILKS